MYHIWQSYDVRFLRYGARHTEFFVILDNFLPFYPPNNPKNQNFEKMKKTPGDIIILHMCTKNYDQMMYGSWDMVCDRCYCYFSFWAIFCPFTPLTAQKIKILKKWKKHLEISSFYTSVPKIMIICYTVPEIWCVTDVIIFHFGLFFALLPLTAQKIRILKKWKKIPANIIILHMGTKNYDQMMHGSWDMVCDRPTDRKSDIRRCVPHLKNFSFCGIAYFIIINVFSIYTCLNNEVHIYCTK